MSDFLLRARLVELEVGRLIAEARRCTDQERLAAIQNELDVRLQALRDIHSEQLVAQITGPPPAPARRRWWQRNRTAAS